MAFRHGYIFKAPAEMADENIGDIELVEENQETRRR
jgi:hypothetical protein